MEQTIKDAFKDVRDAVDVVDKKIDSCNDAVNELKLLISKQNIDTLRAGQVVDKSYCRDSHGRLEAKVKEHISENRAFIFKIVAATWAVLVAILAPIAWRVFNG